nr:Flavodoxin nitric oxide synthase and FAD-binding and Oxidoreductase FAD NAD(P)-binding domain containing protein [Haemonchus contortus]
MGVQADFLILYGSHTGQAECISKQIKEKAEILGLKPCLFTLDDNEKEFHIEEENLVVIVVSSTGDGDPPENASRFWRRISRKTLESNFLEKLDYALLGLGDSNYSTFQGVPNKIDKRLKFLGASPIVETGHADDQVGLELVVEPWIENLFQVLVKRFNLNPDVLQQLNSKVEIAEKREVPEKVSSEGVTSQKPRPILSPQPYRYPEISLIKGNDKLSNDPALRVPVAPQEFLASTVSHEKLGENHGIPWQNGAKMVGVASAPYEVTVVGAARLTDLDVTKPKYELVLDLGVHHSNLPYEPGDAFYFVIPNSSMEVNFILDRMNLLSVADQKCTVSVNPNTQKINPVLPAHVPPESSIRHLFTYCIDIRRTPGRPVLRALAESAADEGEKRRLLELTSAQGLSEFNTFVRQPGLSLADILFAFPSVTPSADRLIELLPRLIPRSYSVSSCRGRRVRFIYSVMNFTAEDGRRYARKGVATEYLLGLKVNDIVQIMHKEPARFRLPPPPLPSACAKDMPLIMVGPGTGVAVFLAFCQHLLNVKLNDPANFYDVPRYLYFGCRNMEKDALYLDELKSYVREGILTELILCESQGNGTFPKYVQDALKERSSQVCEFLSNSGTDVPSRVYICGDAKGMSKGVWQCFHDIIKEQMGKSDADAKAFMTELHKADRYVEDVWS